MGRRIIKTLHYNAVFNVSDVNNYILTVVITYYYLRYSSIFTSEYLTCLWRKYLLYWLIPMMSSKCCVNNCKSGYKNQVKDEKIIFNKILPKTFGKNGKIRSTEIENGQWQSNPLYVVSILKRAILFTIPMTQRIEENEKCKSYLSKKKLAERPL